MRYFTKPDFYFHIGGLPVPPAVDVRVPGAPAFLRGTRALFVSDIHLRERDDPSALLERIAEQNADLLLLGGDYGETKKAAVSFIERLGGIDYKYGKWAVAGNNDREIFADTSELKSVFERTGVHLLINESACLALNGGELYIGGSDDFKRGSPDTKGLFPQTGGYRILLSHWPVRPECSADLMLCGHTHGGQLNLFGINPYCVGFERDARVLNVRGMTKIGDMPVFTGSGIGMSKLPLRIGAAPGIYVLTF